MKKCPIFFSKVKKNRLENFRFSSHFDRIKRASMLIYAQFRPFYNSLFMLNFRSFMPKLLSSLNVSR